MGAHRRLRWLCTECQPIDEPARFERQCGALSPTSDGEAHAVADVEGRRQFCEDCGIGNAEQLGHERRGLAGDKDVTL